MFQVGDLIVYGVDGVYKVESIGVLDMKYANKEKIYYTLSSVFNKGNIYVPVDTDAFMRSVMTYEEAQEMIRQIPSVEINICNDKHINTIVEHYKSLLLSNESSALIQLIKSIYMKGELLGNSGKNLSQTDMNFFRKAEDLLYSELAIVLGIDRDDVVSYIEKSLESNE